MVRGGTQRLAHGLALSKPSTSRLHRKLFFMIPFRSENMPETININSDFRKNNRELSDRPRV